MRLTFISTMSGAPWGGSEELWGRTAMALKKAGHSIGASIHYWEQPAPFVGDLIRAGVNVQMRKPCHPTIYQRILKKLSKRSPGNLSYNGAISWLAESKPDLVCVSNGDTLSGVFWMEYCKNANIPYVSISQCNSEAWWPADEHVEQILPAFKAANKCYFVSEGNRKLFETQIGERLPNLSVVQNPFNVRHDVSLPWPEEKTGFKLACVARLEPPAKGQDIILEVLSKEKWKKRDLRVRFYGKGAYEKNLRKLASALPSGTVEFKGHVMNVEEIWADNHALILPSRYEGLPLALIEAMLCSRMVIVTDVAGNREVVDPGKTGFIASAPTAELVDQAMEAAWDRRADWRSMGIEARRQITGIVPRDPIEIFCNELLSLIG